MNTLTVASQESTIKNILVRNFTNSEYPEIVQKHISNIMKSDQFKRQFSENSLDINKVRRLMFELQSDSNNNSVLSRIAPNVVLYFSHQHHPEKFFW